jgi:hypothetical protein
MLGYVDFWSAILAAAEHAGPSCGKNLARDGRRAIFGVRVDREGGGEFCPGKGGFWRLVGFKAGVKSVRRGWNYEKVLDFAW